MYTLFGILFVVIAVIFYHLGCYAEYKLGIEDTARVVPVHGVWYVHTMCSNKIALRTITASIFSGMTAVKNLEAKYRIHVTNFIK